ncbi:N-acetylmuramoyl-L-alanine amidase family protein [Pelosinus baikalensis]|uniref:N-acetylmuramoyl-L-alanine amidase n=1 Tax=Pelosinus baikalensis TaxID=2892015 RepID=A0ABS8HQT6_9FIRM|nr:N-acetylmuramoyl-L-alanine amidase [Pelosinus baikalensis]MCC5465529.1 N-acetylmuramoyl-L-alanine amidase [Pelosinus baikalensis]
MRIVCNAGHYPGLDSGAVGQTGLQEAIVAADIAQKVCKYLTVVGYEVLFVQENELYQITNASNRFGADLFVSIHCNAAGNESAQGAETWFNNGSVKGRELATCIQDQIVNSIKYPNGENIVDRGIKKATPGINGLYVLSNTNCPAVLVETAFISNADDEQLLADDIKRNQFAAAISRGVTDYVGGM